MSEISALTGVWWFPESPTKRWTGRVSLEPASSLRFDYVIPNGEGFETPSYPRAIHGEDGHGKPMTLLRLGQNSLSSTFKLLELSYSAGHAFTGLHISDTSDLVVTEFDVYMQQLLGWLDRTGFEGSVIYSPNNEANVRYRRPPDTNFVINDQLSVEIVSTVRSWNRGREQGVREDSCLHFSAPGGIAFQKAHDIIGAFAQLLHFATLEPVYPIRVSGRASIPGDPKPKRFEWFSGWMREYVKSEIDPDYWVFRFPDVSTNFGSFCSRWVNLTQSQHESLSSYFTTVYHKLPDSVQHLCLTQALEAYHATRHDNHYRDFELKIRELAEEHRANLGNLYNDSADFAATVRHNRNYYTHHNPRWLADGRVLRDNALYRLNETLRLLFQACILQELQIPEERCKRLLRQIATHIVDYY